jgi:hypothetical protein
LGYRSEESAPIVEIGLSADERTNFMPTLQIQHAITSFDVWSNAFARFAEARKTGGVTHERISRPVDDPNYVIISLDFPSHQQASSFLSFLESNVWSSSTSSPALSGRPQAAILNIEEER